MKRAAKTYELKSIWDSLEPCIRQDMEKLDSRLRTVWSEAILFGVPKAEIEQFVQTKFWELAKQVSEA